ncbi:MAG: hypothetical protein NZ772_03915 [Cyanobacteria bacterium]|nr:hypothetical protein [Cyanobacteriota bacterium]MDW8200576.1 hypothetical protein [Cyanobacteriota bacterium SKYGB_h_bin112]
MSSTPSRSVKQSKSLPSQDTNQPPTPPESTSSSSAESSSEEELKLVRPVRPATPPKPVVSASSPPAVVAVVAKGSQRTTITPTETDGSKKPDSSSATPAPSTVIDNQTANNVATDAAIVRQQPIPPPSERMQYRAIGLIRGKYVASSEQLTRGSLITSDGTTIDAVLLGRVISLIRKHIDLEAEHLWVVYPRTREKEDDLHAQIVGVWEPETLHRLPSMEGQSAEKDEAAADDENNEGNLTSSSANGSLTDIAQYVPASELPDGYFSIRGEVIYHSEEHQRVIVKIRQTPRKASKAEKSFKLLLRGTIASEKVLGRFWDLQVQREADHLVLQSANPVGIVLPKKSASGARSQKHRGKKPWKSGGAGRPNRADGSGQKHTPSARREPTSKPMKRRDKDSG